MHAQHLGHTCWWRRECLLLRGCGMGPGGLHRMLSSLVVSSNRQLFQFSSIFRFRNTKDLEEVKDAITSPAVFFCFLFFVFHLSKWSHNPTCQFGPWPFCPSCYSMPDSRAVLSLPPHPGHLWAVSIFALLLFVVEKVEIGETRVLAQPYQIV